MTPPWSRNGRHADAPGGAAEGAPAAAAGAAPAPASGAAAGAPAPAGAAPAPAEPDPALVAERERLTERFTVMQTELGGLFYEMAIRDSIRLEILMPKAAALQRVDTELSQVQHLLAGGDGAVGGHCPACGTVYARGAAFCSQCATALA